MYAQKSLFIFCCLAVTLPSLACQMGNKTYGHYQKKQSKQDIHVGPDQTSRQKQVLWELTKAKRAVAEQDTTRMANSHLSSPYQTTSLPMFDLPLAHGHQAAVNRPLFASNAVQRTIPAVLCTMLLCANLAQAAGQKPRIAGRYKESNIVRKSYASD